MSVRSLQDLFVYQLEEMYYVEDRLVDVLGQLATDATDEKLQKGFKDHQSETREHVERLEEVFEEIGRKPDKRESKVLEALIEEREEFRREMGSDELGDLFDIQAGMKTERIEMTGYQGLLTVAKKADYDDDVTEPLEDNLSSERSAFHELESLSKGSKLKSMLGKLMN